MAQNSKAWVSLVILACVMALLLFVPAGSLSFWHAWMYLVVFFTAAALTTYYLMKHDSALLSRRLKGGPLAEKEPTQKIIMLFISIGFIALLVVPAFDFRLAWSVVPMWLVVIGDLLVAIGFYSIFLVYNANTFT